MKNVLFILLFLVSSCVLGQDKREEKKSIVQPFFRLSLLNHSQLGNYSLAKDFKSALGVNMALSIVTVKRFSFVTGFHYNTYEITNPQNVGNINWLIFRSLYAEIDYTVPVTNEISVVPLISCGYVENQYTSGSRKFGIQDGSEFKVGSIINYRFNKVLSVFAGCNYAMTNLDIETAEEYVDYFGKAKRIEVQFGLKFGH